MSVTFSPRAIADLESIGDHIAKDSPANAANFIDQLLGRCLEIGHAPDGYMARPELGGNIRSVAFKEYMIFYSRLPDESRVERILHGSRDYLDGSFF